MTNSRPRILIIGSVPPPAIGPSVAMHRLVNAPALHEEFDVSFLDISDRREPTNIGKLEFWNVLLGLKQAFQCVSLLIFRRCDLVYLGISQGTWGYLRDLAFVLPSLCLRRRVVIHLRGSEFKTFHDQMPGPLRWLTRWVFSRVSRVIVLGQGLRKIFDGLMEPARVVAIPNGIDYHQLDRDSSQRVNGPGSKKLLYLSSLMKRKGLLVLLQALPIILKKHPETSLTIAGLWQNGTEKQEAEQIIAANRLDDKLRFVGEATGQRKKELFHQHDLFVFTPVEPEGLPWVILEAMSASLPVVTSDQGAISEVVEQNVTGLIVEPTPQVVADTIVSLLENPDAMHRMGEAGRKRVEEHFSEQVYLAKLIQVFREAARPSSSEALHCRPSGEALPAVAAAPDRTREGECVPGK